jgi:hypothetical protein
LSSYETNVIVSFTLGLIGVEFNIEVGHSCM